MLSCQNTSAEQFVKVSYNLSIENSQRSWCVYYATHSCYFYEKLWQWLLQTLCCLHRSYTWTYVLWLCEFLMFLIYEFFWKSSTSKYSTLSFHVVAPMEGILRYTATVAGHCPRRRTATVIHSHRLVVYVSRLPISLQQQLYCLSLASRPWKCPVMGYTKRIDDKGPSSSTTSFSHKIRFNGTSTSWPDPVPNDNNL